jgi:hypothetical protein
MAPNINTSGIKINLPSSTLKPEDDKDNSNNKNIKTKKVQIQQELLDRLHNMKQLKFKDIILEGSAILGYTMVEMALKTNDYQVIKAAYESFMTKSIFIYQLGIEAGQNPVDISEIENEDKEQEQEIEEDNTWIGEDE